jgi:hypothetical protein
MIAWLQSVTYRLGTRQQIGQEKVQRTLDNLIMPGVDLPPPPKIPSNRAKR